MWSLLAHPLAFAGPLMVPASEPPVRIGVEAPALSAPTSAGTTLELGALEGDGAAVALVFWASWCPGCDARVREVAAWAEGRSVPFYAVNVDRDRASGERAAAALPPGVIVAWDPDATALGAWGGPDLPATFLVDDRGLVLAAIGRDAIGGAPAALSTALDAPAPAPRPKGKPVRR